MYSVKPLVVHDQEWHLITVQREDFEVTLMDYGAAIYSILTPDRNGTVENVVIKYEDIEAYRGNNRHLNATIGPTAGRIQNGSFFLADTTYQLDKNFEDKHNLHGGDAALSHTLFDYKIMEEQSQTQVIFTTYQGALQHGYPGHQQYSIIYTIKAYTIDIEFVAETDETTLVNLTNHAYFNLSGNLKRNVLHHYVSIQASNWLELNDEMIPVGVQAVDPEYDFRDPKEINREPARNIDHPYLLDEVGFEHIQATLFDPGSGRQLEVQTTYPSIVCYDDNFPMTYQLAHSVPNTLYMGVCFETQNPPNGIHLENVESSILLPEERYYQKTRFTFSIKE